MQKPDTGKYSTLCYLAVAILLLLLLAYIAGDSPNSQPPAAYVYWNESSAPAESVGVSSGSEPESAALSSVAGFAPAVQPKENSPPKNSSAAGSVVDGASSDGASSGAAGSDEASSDETSSRAESEKHYLAPEEELPSKPEKPDSPASSSPPGESNPPEEGESEPESSQPEASEPARGIVNLNTATEEQLCTLEGIGPALAKRILEFREAAGGFTSIEEILEVSGIGEKRFEAIRNYITV